MIYYKNIFLSVSNGLNSKCVSTVPNQHADIDAQMLACSCLSDCPVTASNGKQYYYFSCDYWLNDKMIQYLLNCNGVLAHRRYSTYQALYGNRHMVVRVPVDYLKTHENANAFINKVINLAPESEHLEFGRIPEYVSLVQKRMRQK